MMNLDPQSDRKWFCGFLNVIRTARNMKIRLRTFQTRVIASKVLMPPYPLLWTTVLSRFFFENFTRMGGNWMRAGGKNLLANNLKIDSILRDWVGRGAGL